MVITRIINDQKVQIELTCEELHQAYEEQNKDYIAQDIESRYDIDNINGIDLVEQVQIGLSKSDAFMEAYWTVIEQVCDNNNASMR